MIDIKELTQLAKNSAIKAGEEILKVYNSDDFGVEVKGDDSPLTKADQQGHEVIMSFLEQTKLPVLSEEGKNISVEERKSWEYFWMVDPLDGTKEFIKRNGEFTVNIALIHNCVPILGVVFAPVLGWLYWGNEIDGAWKQEQNESPTALKVPENQEVKTIVASRSHISEETQAFIDQYTGAEVISMGSSLKFMLVAENKAQVYPRFAPTMEWDTAAAHGIILALGGDVTEYKGRQSLIYNKRNLLNPSFIACIKGNSTTFI